MSPENIASQLAQQRLDDENHFPTIYLRDCLDILLGYCARGGTIREIARRLLCELEFRRPKDQY